MIGGIGADGASPLHRLPAGSKLAGLAVIATALFFVDVPAVLAIAAVIGGAAMLSTGRAPARLARDLALPGLAVVLVGLADVLLVDAATALVAVLRLAALLFFAQAVTLTTSTGELADTLERALVPFDRLGLLDAPRVALTLTLAIRFVPLIGAEIAAIREAQAVRGLAGHPVALAVPLIVRILVRAEEIADAIDARGFPPPRGPGILADRAAPSPAVPSEDLPHDHP
ncbi:energy-coupling factor transporter transmembrane protein EcfT [Siculibacillus lacustris]|uniref:Energy-coupling factor transporter transmembrane protein EcfT n=1 Tax=Siculibacillus lacustris TaxID=1549641 RepID=A0A4Q9VGD5_9HYPH|nr:energy-coupling factor transporter transmembrane protein EcfT [Siculibacillus lacustris]TBW34070.1 energy-coupling factor transporter transmembrane protein EcfT [Siculibacillus lacustris]